jgi:hypothetical protein
LHLRTIPFVKSLFISKNYINRIRVSYYCFGMNYVSILFLYSKIKYNLWHIAEESYSKYSIVRKACDVVQTVLSYATFLSKKYIYQEVCEPPSISWIHYFKLIHYPERLDKQEYDFKESYELITPSENTVMIREYPNLRNAFLLVKIGNPKYYLSYHWVPSPLIKMDSLESSEITFLSVEYTHPKMKESIVLILSKELFVVGNELLSAPFVYRWLSYQSKPFVFDENYRVNVIDSNVKFITVKYGQYLLIKKKESIVCLFDENKEE